MPSLREELGNVDLLTAEDGQERLLETLERREQRIRDEMRQGDERVQQESTRQVGLTEARRAADEHNDRVFSEGIAGNESYASLPEDIQRDVRRTFEQQIGDDMGSIDENRQWRWKPEAVDAAVWASPKAREYLIGKETATARNEGLQARQDGERARDVGGQGNRVRPQNAADEALLVRAREVRQQLQNREITRDEAARRFTPDEFKRYRELIRRA